MPYRVKDENGHHITVAVISKGQTELPDEPALDRNGRWARPKTQTPRHQSDAGKATQTPAAAPAAVAPATTEAKEATA